MKKFWKIFGITLGSIIGVLLIAVLVAIYVVFTPQRLTPIVRNVADQYVGCPHELGDVELTFFSTFPEFGLQINGLYLINPMEGAKSDTLLATPKVVAKVNVMRFLRENTLDVPMLELEEVTANLFFNEEGKSNLDVFILPEDSTEEDTTAFSLPFDRLEVGSIRMQSPQLSYSDKQNDIDATIGDVLLEASADGLEDIDLALTAEDVNATIGGERYAEHLSVSFRADDTDFDLDSLRVILHDAQLSVNEFGVKLNGMAGMPNDIVLDLNVQAADWDAVELLKLLPQSITSLLDGIDIDQATVSVSGDVRGIYNDSVMPLIDADVTLRDGKAAYMEVFPYRISDIQMRATAHVDMNEEEKSEVSISKLHARTGKTTLDATGRVCELLGDPLCDVCAKANVHLPEFKRYLESDGINTDLDGTAKGSLTAKIRLSALSNMQLQRGVISGNFDISNLSVVYDSLSVDIPSTTLAFRIPNQKPTKNTVDWISATLVPTSLNFEMIDFLKAGLGGATIQLEASDVLNKQVIYANIGVKSSKLNAETDSMGVVINAPELQAYAEYDTKAENTIPMVDASLALNDLEGFYTDINATLQQSEFTAHLSGTDKDKSQPKARVSLKTSGLKTTMGEDVHATTGRLNLTALAQYDPSKENILLQWNPRLQVDLNDGVADLKSFGEQIQLPQITFAYSNKVFNISQSEIIVGKSDFSLVGEIRNIGKWIDKQGNLEGELSFTSDYTDVNELMALISADSGSEETATEVKTEEASVLQASAEDSNPFLVPKDVDLTLNTHIKQATVFDQIARDLGGKLYIKDGVLVLEEMGFICKAAKLQLTAMYKTPRRNHLYVGLDYHMLDINIEELVNMIPQIDTMLPMLRSFRGGAEFHIAAETYLNSKYELKTSTTKGACSIEGKDLVLLDGETFTQIAKILMFNKKTENKVDSLSAQFTVYKDEIDIYPFCLTIDKYMAAVGGHHNLDMSFDYHISLLKPLYIGVDVKGTFEDLKIKLAKCRYAQDFRPIIHKDVETQNASLKKLINEALKRSVSIE